MTGMASNKDNSPAMQAIINEEIAGWAESLSHYHWDMEQQRKQLVRDAEVYAGKSQFDMVADTYRTMDRIAKKISEIRARMDGLQACMI